MLLVTACGHAQRGAITRPRDLVDLTLTANQIVQGRVVAVAVDNHSEYKNIKILSLTLALDDVLKGSAGTTVTLHQFLWDIRDISDGAGYRVGDEVLLFLNKPTSLGLTSPVGLEQGRFRVSRGDNAEYFAVNGSQNAGLFRDPIASGSLKLPKLTARSRASIQSFSHGAIPLSALKESVHLLLGTPGVAK